MLVTFYTLDGNVAFNPRCVAYVREHSCAQFKYSTKVTVEQVGSFIVQGEFKDVVATLNAGAKSEASS